VTRAAGQFAMAAGPGGAADPAVPLTVLTGFLGTGKTTLVNRILNGALGIPVGVLVNDFGAVNIDQALIAEAAEGVISLENGCICCSLRADLVDSVLRLLDRPDAPQRILLEASGVADPAPIAGTFLAPAFRHQLRLDGIVCVVDAERAFTDPAVEPLQMRQVGYSDLVVLNKTDLAGPAQTARTAARIRANFAGARVFPTTYCDVPPELLFSGATGDRVGPARLRSPAVGTSTAHETRFKAWTFRSEGVFCADALHELARRLPPTVYRGKGIVRVRSRRRGPERRGILQIVGRRADLADGGAWPEDHPPSALVFIGAADQFRADELEALVTGCLSTIERNPGARSCGD
jgi:G3E family GTPase